MFDSFSDYYSDYQSRMNDYWEPYHDDLPVAEIMVNVEVTAYVFYKCSDYILDSLRLGGDNLPGNWSPKHRLWVFNAVSEAVEWVKRWYGTDCPAFNPSAARLMYPDYFFDTVDGAFSDEVIDALVCLHGGLIENIDHSDDEDNSVPEVTTWVLGICDAYAKQLGITEPPGEYNVTDLEEAKRGLA